MRRPRHLSPEERALWEHVTRRDTPVAKPKATIASPAPPRIPEVNSPVEPRSAPVQPFRVGEKVDHRRSNDLLPGLAEDMARAPVRMDAKAFGKMKKGKLVPDARIDLHGMTLDEAHPALVGFMLTSYAMGRRLVLVITGKGKVRDDLAPMPVRQGILRHQVPQWLMQVPLRPLILQITPAHISHGGTGAYYVYLRRNRV
jgi:DNA-nicking Smr family endonuclease